MLSSTIELLHTARRNAYAIGAFNIYNLEGVRAVVEAAEAFESPAMLQLHPSALSYGKSPLVALCMEAARSAKVPIAVHLDHSTSANDIQAAITAGMNSIMADGSALPYEDNLTFTREMTALAHRSGVVVEAEIGRISGTEDGLTIAEKEAKMTDPSEAAEFVQATQVDALAVTIGNVHGKYHSEPKLDFQRLLVIRKLVEVPLVLHGASGLPEAMINQSIQFGVCKFNVNTEVREAYLEGIKSSSSLSSPDLLAVMEQVIVAMQSVISAKLQLFGSVGKAHLHQVI
ncbi:fructose/tagatose bisphosphate aldolase [uncultured Synechococcales cyanobacterium]|uniref:Fructose/tagatose bisphosphate aldolase n=1 Tax=uncultured Synechococcales cyanobacterium TaxID=1936017 RepID=A0A6J4V0K0_9CYAN|nr:fructose/tagatose bisphosphate aldolase [uncultured Synechococcales cyanobacterium]